MDALKTIKLKHVTVNLYQDLEYPNPREDYDPLATIAFKPNRYVSADVELTEDLFHTITKDETFHALPVYAYIHSGVTISLTPFSCRWDSGQMGYIYIDKETVLKNFPDTTHWIEKAKEIMTAEIKTFDDYLQGNCYCFTVTDNYTDEVLESIGGFLGNIDYAESEALESAKFYESKTEKLCSELVISAV